MVSKNTGRSDPTKPTMTTSTPQSGHFDYFALPGEIRNQIMELVLAPGDVHYIQPRKKSKKSTQPLPTVQFLALNRQAYAEGRKMFYSENSFHLPAGPEAYTKSMLDRYQPQNFALIRRLTLDIGLHDLCYVEKFKQFDTKTWGPTLFNDNGLDDCLVEVWKSKIILIRERFHNLEELRIVFWDLDYAEMTETAGFDHSFHQPYPLLSDNEATNGGAASKSVLALVYTGEEIKAALQDIHMDPDWPLIDSRASMILREIFTEATIYFSDVIRDSRTWEGLRRQIAKMAAEQELRIRG